MTFPKGEDLASNQECRLNTAAKSEAKIEKLERAMKISHPVPQPLFQPELHLQLLRLFAKGSFGSNQIGLCAAVDRPCHCLFMNVLFVWANVCFDWKCMCGGGIWNCVCVCLSVRFFCPSRSICAFLFSGTLSYEILQLSKNPLKGNVKALHI